MVVYISDPKKYARKLLQCINTFSKKAGYDANSRKSVALLCTSLYDKPTKKKIGEKIPFTIA